MILSFNDRFVLQALEGMTDAELWRPPTACNNPILWVAGHIVQTRATVFTECSARRSRPDGASEYPAAPEVARVMRDIRLRPEAALSVLTNQLGQDQRCGSCPNWRVAPAGGRRAGRTPRPTRAPRLRHL
ncbi:MAG: DinB family protein [Terriglobales bacterium]